jgi:hypothetical protein
VVAATRREMAAGGRAVAPRILAAANQQEVWLSRARSLLMRRSWRPVLVATHRRGFPQEERERGWRGKRKERESN